MRRAMPGAVPARRPALLPTGALTMALLVAGVLLAGPAKAAPTTTPEPTAGTTSSSAAAAVVDPTRPTARVVHGPNCSDGFVRVEVTAGTAARTVALRYDGASTGSAVDLAAGERVTLEGSEVAPGTVVAVSVAVGGPDGDEQPVDLGTYPRPSTEDCEAVTGPTGTTAPTPTTPPTSTDPTTPPTTTSAPTTTPRPTTPTPSTTRPTTPSTSGPSSGPSSEPSSEPTSGPTSAPTPGSTTGPAPSVTATPDGPVGGSSSAGQVSPGSVLTIRGSGFSPGEQVTVSLDGSAASLATVTADDQGQVEAVVQIPQDVLLGPAVVRLVGSDSTAVTEVSLEVAARDTASTGGPPLPMLAAGLALLGVAVGLATVAARRPRADDRQPHAGRAG